MSESVFQATVQKLRRIVIPKPICEALEVRQGDKVEIKLRKVQKHE
jgi:AbrB family looped-hinge helix DNA binding protein